ASLCGSTPLPFDRVRAHHRSDRDVSFLFQSQRSPAPDLRPVTCPNGGGTFLACGVHLGEMNTVWWVAVAGDAIAAARLSLPAQVDAAVE
ncbi:MAG: hypothetical protein ACQETI_14485, partial [Halobacteriota archaeon]